MAVTAAYATAAQYRAVTGRTDAGQDAEILTDLTAISRYLDGKLGRFFTRDLTTAIRLYRVYARTCALWVDDMAAAPTQVRIDGAIIAALNYRLLPLNALQGPEPRPFTRIELLHQSFGVNSFVEVTASFGWPAVPVAIQRATIHLTALLRLETQRATKSISELGEAVDASPDAQSIVRQLTDPYRRVTYA